jgi:predicted Fe-Mo cluster-binding NifX family protein
MKVAVTSQNRREVTAHAGRCRNFWIYEVEAGRICGLKFLELPRESSFHDAPSHGPHPLDGIQVLITGGMGDGLRARLARRGIEALVTSETVPERAVQAWLDGHLPRTEPRSHGHGVDHDEAGGQVCSCGGGCGC